MNAIEIRELRKTYPDFTLDGINLTLPGGCIMGLVGENGAGKSTTIKLILDMIPRDGGSVTILGRDNREKTVDIKEEIGVVLDVSGLPSVLNAAQIGHVMKNIYRNWEEETYQRLLADLNVPKNKAFKDCSRGMKMKLSIAVAMSHGAKVLILDEATSGLDPVARDHVLELLEDFTRDEEHAILMSSHIVSDLEKSCDYIAFLHRGRLILCGEKDRLGEEYGVIHCTMDRLSLLPAEAVIGYRENAYGVEAVVRREWVPAGTECRPAGIEELFVYMVKGEK